MLWLLEASLFALAMHVGSSPNTGCFLFASLRMIRYSKTWCGFTVLFRLDGTSWPYGVIPGSIAVLVSIALELWEEVDDRIRDRNNFIDHPYAFQLFAYMLGFLMVFRTNFAYQRYWEAMGHLQAMGAKWLDGTCMGIVFDSGGNNMDHLLHGMFDEKSLEPHSKTAEKGGPVHSVFAQDLCHLCSLACRHVDNFTMDLLPPNMQLCISDWNSPAPELVPKIYHLFDVMNSAP